MKLVRCVITGAMVRFTEQGGGFKMDFSNRSGRLQTTRNITKDELVSILQGPDKLIERDGVYARASDARFITIVVRPTEEHRRHTIKLAPAIYRDLLRYLGL